MASAYDTIVVGVGGMGAAALYQLAKRGQRVLGLERFDLGHAMGSSHGHTRILRLAYFEGSHYVPLARRAHRLWQEIGAEAGMRLLHVTGSLDLAPEGQGTVERARHSCVDHGLAHEMLDARQLASRYPALRLTPRHTGLLQPDGGFVLAEQAIFAHAGLALKHGADIHTGETVQSWRPTAAGGVEVTTDRATYAAGQLVLAAGAWIKSFAPDVLARVTTVKQAIGWFPVRQPELFRPAALPVFILTVEEGNFYGLPLFEHAGFKLGGPHFAREAIDPDDPDRTPSPKQVAALQACLERYIPGAAGRPLAVKGCMYTVTPDEHFIIDRLPGHRQVIVASPCSGHGYKFASVIGEILAELAVDGATRADISPFAIGRLAVLA